MPRSAKRVLVEFYAVNNLGDDLLLKVLLDRFPEVQFLAVVDPACRAAFSGYGNLTCLDSPVHGLANRLRHRLDASLGRAREFEHRCRVWRAFYRRLARSVDAYVHLGGSIFMEPSAPKVHEVIYADKVRSFRGRVTLVIDANFGPFRSADYLERYRRIFTEMTAVSFRDHYSRALFADLPNVHRAADLVFGLTLPDAPRLPGSIAFAPIDLTGRPALREHAAAYIDGHAALVREALRGGLSVHFFSFCEQQGDERAISSILGRLRAEERAAVEVVPYRDDMDAILVRYAQMERSVPTRFHAVVLSLIAGHRLLPLVYSEKTRQSLADLAFAGPLLELDALDPQHAGLLLERAVVPTLPVARIAADADGHCRLLADALSLAPETTRGAV